MAEPFIGQVDLFGFQFAPENWALCEGQVITINSNQAMFSLLGTAYGGDGRTTFGFPDLRGRLNCSQGRHPGSAYDWKVGNVGGSETHRMKITEFPQHAHLASYSGSKGSLTGNFSATTNNGNLATPTTASYRSTTLPPGGGPDKPELTYASAPSAGSLVSLGGAVAIPSVLSGTVTVDNNGSNDAFFIMQTSLTMNYSIAQTGLFPSRS